MGRIISTVSGKGGVGKTMFVANLGIALAKAGFRVCLVDADIAMANLSLLLGLQSSPITLHDVLLGESTLQDAIYEGPENVSLIPSGLSLESYRRVDSEKLADAIEPLADRYDYIILDGPPGISKDVMACLAASKECIFITQPTSPAIADLFKVKTIAQRLGVKALGIVVNFTRNEKGEISSTEIMKMLELPVLGEIPYDENVRKTFLQKNVRPVMLRVPSCEAAKAIRKIAERISGTKIPTKEKAKIPIFPRKSGTIKKGFIEKILSFLGFRRRE